MSNPQSRFEASIDWINPITHKKEIGYLTKNRNRYFFESHNDVNSVQCPAEIEDTHRQIFQSGMRKRWILVALPPLPLPRFRFCFLQNVVILLVAIPPTYLEAADQTNRFRFRFQNTVEDFFFAKSYSLSWKI